VPTSNELAIGFVLERRNATLGWASGRPYRGIDRLPWVTDPLDPQTDPVWNEYLDAWEDGALSRDAAVASRLAGALSKVSDPVEVVYANIVRMPPAHGADPAAEEHRARSLAWLHRRRGDVVPAAPTGFGSLGFDVSSVVPSYHSILVQPGPVSHDKLPSDGLNEHGLLNDLALAGRLMDEANASGYLQSMFAVFELRGRDAR